jgi:hypothetical protein
LGATGLLAIDAVCRMKVHGPAAEGDGVVMFCLADNIALGQDVITFETTALTLAGNSAYPFKGEGFCLWKIAGVFDVIPYPVGNLPKLPFDLFGLVDRVETSAILKPPETASSIRRFELSVAENVTDVTDREGRWNKFDGLAGVATVEIKRMTEQ